MHADPPAKSGLLDEFLARREKIERFLVARLGNSADAEDVLQEMFVRLTRAQIAGDVRDPAAYLFRMALNEARDYRRGLARSRVREEKWADAQYSMQDGSALSDAPSAETELAGKQLLARVKDVLSELSPQCQRVFRLHKFDGLSHQDVAEKLGISRRTVEKHMHTALLCLVKRVDRD